MANDVSSNNENDSYLKRRKSDSNLLKSNSSSNGKDKTSQLRKRATHMTQVNKSISITMAEKQLSRQATILKKDNNPQEDTFYRALEIKFHHSVGSMSISPACRDVVLAG